jgi:hypothetical protein
LRKGLREKSYSTEFLLGNIWFFLNESLYFIGVKLQGLLHERYHWSNKPLFISAATFSTYNFKSIAYCKTKSLQEIFIFK